HYMVPRHILTIDALPTTPNGKLDHAALLARAKAAEEQRAAEGARAIIEPRDAIEVELLAKLRALLPGAHFGVDDNLFERGADSVLVLQFLGHVTKQYEIEISVKEAFGRTSVAAWRELIRDKERAKNEELEALLERVESL